MLDSFIIPFKGIKCIIFNAKEVSGIIKTIRLKLYEYILDSLE